MKIEIVNGTLIKTNNYVVGDDKEVVLIEASANINEIKSKISNRKVLAILLTHGHWDHFYYLDKYIDEFKCKVYMTEEAFKKINLRDKNFLADKNPRIELSAKDVVFIKDNDLLKFNELTFKVVETKGHTNCSVCYQLKDFLFSGDTLFKNDVGRSDLPTGNYEELLESLKKIFSLQNDIIVYPGHGPSTVLKNESAVGTFC